MIIEPIVMFITDDEEKQAMAAARKRHAYYLGIDGYIPRNHGPDVRSNRAFFNHILGTRTELIARRYLAPIHWNDYLEQPESGAADLYCDHILEIDVKGRSAHHYDLLVPLRHCKDTMIYLLVTAQHPEYHILGWCWGWEARRRKIRNFGGAAYCVKQDDPCMKPQIELWRLT